MKRKCQEIIANKVRVADPNCSTHKKKITDPVSLVIANSTESKVGKMYKKIFIMNLRKPSGRRRNSALTAKTVVYSNNFFCLY